MRIYSAQEIESAYNTWAERTKKAITDGVANFGTINNWEFNFVKCVNGTIPERAQKDYERQFGDKYHKATPVVICKHCGFPESLTYYKDVQDKLLESGYCHKCQLWHERTERISDDNIFIAMNGNERVFYSMGRNTSPFGNESYNGHSGAVFKIEKRGESKPILCNNVWHGGDIDYLWADSFPLNAVLLPSSRKEYINWWINESGRCSSNEIDLLAKRVMHEVTPSASKEEALESLRESGWVVFTAIQRIENARKQPGEARADHS